MSAAAIGIGAIMAFTSIVPVTAQPMPLPRPQAETGTDLVQVREQGRRIIRQRHNNWRGHRGYRYHRHGYRRHSNGFWYPLAAFSAGAIIGGAIAAPSVRVRTGNPHRRWCRNHYRSYRAYDNSFQPYNGPRRQCMSPYGG
ncbi:BA14K family protein [Rhizobium sp. SG_E_25_P2]|uniref:BA14K family protein n=1 Tax=Rhizobium sp. SG_E_25_P2 TaxID=2879942 RepID=UPI002473BFDB|nr:BA14K family protein [Rhizobium sp. SG_E_25_P2]